MSFPALCFSFSPLFLPSQSSSQSASGCEGPCCFLISGMASEILLFTLSSLTQQSRSRLFECMWQHTSSFKTAIVRRMKRGLSTGVCGFVFRSAHHWLSVHAPLSTCPYLPAKKFRLRRQIWISSEARVCPSSHRLKEWKLFCYFQDVLSGFLWYWSMPVDCCSVGCAATGGPHSTFL